MPNTPRYLEQGPEARPRNLLADYARDYGLHGLSNRLNDPTSGIGLITDAVGSVAMPAYNALMSPYRALTGEMGDYETNKDAYIQAGMDVAGTAMTGGLAAPRPQNSLGALSSRIQKQIHEAQVAANPGVDPNKLTQAMRMPDGYVEINSPVGYISAEQVNGGPLRIMSSGLDGATERGKGYGAALYDGAAQYASSYGVPLQSDSMVSPAASRMYQRLERDYGVEMSPNAARQRFGSIQTADDSPVFTVNVPPSGAYPPPLPDALMMDASGYPDTQYAVWGRGTVRSPLSGDLLYANGGKPGAATGAAVNGSIGMSGRPQANALAAERSLDALGYYSQALEAARSLKQAKGTPEQMLAQLKSAGVKDAEIEATGLRGFLDGKRSVTRDEIAGHLEANRVGLREVIRSDNAAPPKWQDYSLDPSNPTYRETVLHLPSFETPIREARKPMQVEFNALQERYSGRGNPLADAEVARMEQLREKLNDNVRKSKEARTADFRQHHFENEPNVIGHMMTSMTKHEGRPVYTIDQIQSDWGQKLRDGGVRDEAKIAELKRRMSEMTSDTAALSEIARLQAELRTAEAATPGNPLVNTTDQWVNTTLRRALRQAADSEADYVAIPSGKTVLSYNPGDERGMQAFYDQIVPKNLGNILGKYGKPQRQYVETLDTPSRGAAGQGFSLFQLTPDARDQIKQGMPLFANGRPGAATGAAVNANNNDDGLNAILNKYGLSDLLRPSGDWTTKVRPGDA